MRRQIRSHTIFYHVCYKRRAYFISHLFQLFNRPWCFDKYDVSSSLSIGLATFDRFVKVHWRAGVSSCNDDKVFAFTCFKCCLELWQVLIFGYDILPYHMAASLWPNLVFEKNAGSAQSFKVSDKPPDIERVAIACICIN